MKLCHPDMERMLDFETGPIQTLVIENIIFFRKYIYDLYQQLDGESGDLILSDTNKCIPISKNVEIIDNFLHFDINTKTLTNKLSALLEKISVLEGYYLKTNELLCNIEQWVNTIAFTMPCDVICSKCTTANILKAIGVTVRDTSNDPLERILDYMELVRELDNEKLFVFVNLHSFFSRNELNEFLKTAREHGYMMLLLESEQRYITNFEKILIIDKDLCEI